MKNSAVDKETVPKTVRVRWDAPRSLKETQELKDGNLDVGIYQVYGEHVVFGSGALLYIGKACDQTFGERFVQHVKWLDYESDPFIRVGRIESDCYQSDAEWERLVDCVEALTIYWHSPPYNSRCIVRYDKPEFIRVQNWGHRGRLMPEYSSPSEWRRPDDAKER